jgi:RNA polymerase sigma-70 factor (ECF subfamily)
MLAEERVRILRQALGELPPKMRQVVYLRLDQGLKYREIAAAARVSIDTVKAHLHQARRQLEARLLGYFAGADLGRLAERHDEQ